MNFVFGTTSYVIGIFNEYGHVNMGSLQTSSLFHKNTLCHVNFETTFRINTQNEVKEKERMLMMMMT